MGKLLNSWSLFLALLSGGLVIVLSSNFFTSHFIQWLGVHPLKMVYYFTMIVLLIGILGFSGVNDWKAALRSVLAVGLAAVILVFLAYIIYVGNLVE